MKIDTDVDSVESVTRVKENKYENQPSTPDTQSSESPSHFYSPTLTIEHKVAESDESKSSNFSSCISSLLKLMIKKEGKVMAMIVCYSILATVGGSLMYNRYNSLNKKLGLNPILNDFEGGISELTTENERLKSQVIELSEEIGQLANEVSRLHDENEMYQELNMRLTGNVTTFHENISTLKEQNDNLESLNDQLNATNVEFGSLIADLESANNEYSQSIQGLERLNAEFEDEIDRLQYLNTNLTKNLNELSVINDNLSSNLSYLQHQNILLEGNIETLDGTIDDLYARNFELESLNSNLTAVVSYLDNKGKQGEESLNDIVTKLSELINDYRSLALRDLEIQYDTKIGNFPCEIDIFYGDEKFVFDPTESLADKYAMILDFMDTRILSEICADVKDFEKFMIEEVHVKEGENDSFVSLIELLDSMEVYASLLHDYYFSDGVQDDEASLSIFDWEVANYQCDELPNHLRYTFYDEN